MKNNMKKMIAILLIFIVACNSVFATVTFSKTGDMQDIGKEATGVFSGAMKIIFFVGIVICVLGIAFLGLSTMLGITVGDKLKSTLLRIFGGVAIVCVAGYVPSLLGLGGASGGATGAVVEMTAETFKALTGIV